MKSIGLDIGGSAVKFAVCDGDNLIRSAQSDAYHRPDRNTLAASIRALIGDRHGGCESVGVCLPGVLNEQRDALAFSVHLPALVGVPLEDLVAEALGEKPAKLTVVSDAVAAAYDLFAARRISGRLMLVAIGTGIGAAVLDDGISIRVNQDSPGHLGQIDVSLSDFPPVAPDGGAGGLEAYLSAAALRREYGPDVPAAVLKLTPDDPPLRALVRALRIAHAIYRPHHVVLAGGIGIHLGHVLPGLRSTIEKNLTRLARPQWTLSTGDNEFHAARGAARLAAIA